MRACSVLAACCAVLSFAAVAQAQGVGSGRERVTVGVKGGISASNWRHSYKGESSACSFRAGVTAGGFVEIPIAPHLALQPEILWSMKGGIPSAGRGYLTEETTYLDIPVLVLYRFAVMGGKASPYVFGGPTIGVLLSATSWYSWGGSRTGSDVKSHMASTEYGLAIGGGVQIRRLPVDCRYTVGLTNIWDRDSSSSLSDVLTKNRALAVMVGMRF